MIPIKTIDAHTAGDPLRLIVDGFPHVEGQTMLERREWMKKPCGTGTCAVLAVLAAMGLLGGRLSLSKTNREP